MSRILAPTVPCALCGASTPMTATKRCDRCWELETRIQGNPELARRILAAAPAAQDEREAPSTPSTVSAEALSDEEMRKVVLRALRDNKATDREFEVFTRESGPYGITGLRGIAEAVCRAVESAILARAVAVTRSPQ